MDCATAEFVGDSRKLAVDIGHVVAVAAAVAIDGIVVAAEADPIAAVDVAGMAHFPRMEV